MDLSLEFIKPNIQSRLVFCCHLCTNPYYYYTDTVMRLGNHYLHHQIDIERRGDYQARQALPENIGKIIRQRCCYNCPFCHICFSVMDFSNSGLIQRHMTNHIQAGHYRVK